jgi:hypothetical protein
MMKATNVEEIASSRRWRDFVEANPALMNQVFLEARQLSQLQQQRSDLKSYRTLEKLTMGIGYVVQLQSLNKRIQKHLDIQMDLLSQIEPYMTE